jgi:hypothetical protein
MNEIFELDDLPSAASNNSASNGSGGDGNQ